MVPVSDLAERAGACAAVLRTAESVVHASHNDADGLTSGAIGTTALERAGVPVETVFCKQLDGAAVADLAAREPDVLLFTDFGSGQLEAIREHTADTDVTPVVVDHHQPVDLEIDYHLNPLLAGIDGASELSGAGAAYLLARAMAEQGAPAGGTEAEAGAGDAAVDGTNRDLAGLAVVGAVGDMQATGGELVGANREIVVEGVAAGVLEEATDLALYGRQTRPLPKLLEYASEVQIPGITNDEAGAVAFLRELEVDLTAGPEADGDWRRWVDLADEERRTLASALVRRAIQRGVPAEKVDGLVGTTYELTREAPGTELRDASEFSTLLNATARYERADVGLAVCLGDREEALSRARTLLADHRRNLSAGLEFVKERGVERADHLQYFEAGDAIRDTIVGIVAGMALGVEGVDRDRPIVAFAAESEGETKVSARASGALVARGLDLSAVMAEAAAAVGGAGGGHDVAAGATIPRGAESAFVAEADAVVADQLD